MLQRHLTNTYRPVLFAAFIFQVAAVATSSAVPCSEPSECGATSAALVQRDHKRWRHRDLGIQPQSCAGRLKQTCGANSMCAWHENLSRCQARIAWFHIMKCGSSFGATLAHFANSSLPELAHMPSCSGNVSDAHEDSCENGTQGARDFFKYKYPMHEWFPDVFWTTNRSSEPGAHRPIQDSDFQEWKGHFVGLFRSPQARVASAYNHFVIASLDKEEKLWEFNHSRQMHYLKKFAAVARGTVTKMLSGMYDVNPIRCEMHFDNWIMKDSQCLHGKCRRCLKKDPSAAALKLALARLQKFSFVGLTDHFDLSVCLFHAMFGGECWPVEFANMRKSLFYDNYSDFLADHAIEDPYDRQIFTEASKMFWSNVARYNVTTENCLRMCPGSNASFTMS